MSMRSLAFALLALLALLTVALRHGAAATPKGGDLRLSRIAGDLARRPVTIRCEGRSGALTGPEGESGRTEFLGKDPVSESYLREGICETLHAYRRTVRPTCLLPCGQALEIAWSMNTLAHESYHLAGVRNEAETQCYALQAIDFVAHSLGASDAQARALATFSFENLPQRMPPEYTSPECHDGGKLDLFPDNSRWP